MKVNIKEIKNNPNNPRILKDFKFKKLVKSVKEFPEMLDIRPIVVNKDMIVLWGNMRLRACIDAWFKEIPIIQVKNLTEEQEQEFIIKDNSSFWEWDFEMLANEWDVEKLNEWGLDIELPEIVDAEKEAIEDEVPEISDNIIVEKWDIFQLGEHRLLFWDSTIIDDVEKLMDWEKADMVFTDPPYKIETKWGCEWSIGRDLKKQWNDIDFISNFEPQGFLNFLPIVFNKNHNSYIFCNKDLLPEYLKWAVDNKISFNVLIWKKPNAIPICDSHRPDIEYLLLFRKNAIWNSWLKNINYSRCLEYWRETWLHPTMKPVWLLENELYISSNKWSIIVDFFWWSWSTLIACEKTNRKCYMMEIEPSYIQVILKRYNTYTDWQKEIKCLNREMELTSIYE